MLAASEPNLKVRCKPRKCLDRRKNPLTRKESAPPSLKRRPPEAIGEDGVTGGGSGRPWGQAGAAPGCPGSVCGAQHPTSALLGVQPIAGAPWMSEGRMLLQLHAAAFWTYKAGRDQEP